MMKLKKIVALFILGLLLIPLSSKLVFANEEVQLIDVEITYVFDSENDSILVELSEPYGSSLSLTPPLQGGYTFAFWIVNGVVRYDLPEAHTFIVSSNMILQGVYSPATQHVVLFIDSNGELISTQFVGNNLPAVAPNVLGRPGRPQLTFASILWRNQLGVPYGVSTGITQDTVFILQYERSILDEYTMTVNGIEQGPYLYNELVTLTADALNGSEIPFSHWEENGVMLSRDLNYSFTAVKDRMFTAVYSNTPDPDLPLVSLLRDIEKRNGYHTYIGQFYLPETSYTLVEYGFLIHANNTLELTKDTVGVTKAQSGVHLPASNEYVMSFPIGSHMNVRAYFTYKVGTSVTTIYSEVAPRYIDNVAYETGFENTTKGSYVAADANIDGISWNLADTLIGDLSNDRKEGSKSARIQASGTMSTNTPIENLTTISLKTAKYGTDGNASLSVWVSKDGNNWVNVTDGVEGGTIPVTTTTLTLFEVNLLSSQSYLNGAFDPSDALYFRISKSGGTRVNVDALSFNNLYKGETNLVTYNNEDILSVIATKTGSNLSQPTQPTKTGYTFDGWFIEETLVTEYLFNTPVTTDFTLYAGWLVNEYTISFDSNGGSLVEAITQDFETAVLEPVDPTKDGYLFDAWYSDEALTVPYSFTTMPAGNVTLYAKWNIVNYDINYDLDGGTNNGSNPITYNIETSTITLEPATKDGYTFNGWFGTPEKDGAIITTIDLGSFGDRTLYAKFTIISGVTYTVSIYNFEGDGNALLDTQVVNDGAFATRPASDPTRAGYVFDDWYQDGEVVAFDFATTPVTVNIIIYGEWIELFTVTFDSNEGSAVASQEIEDGSLATEPTDPTRDGFTFEGWFTDDETFSLPFDFESPIIADRTLYAKWSESVTIFIEDFSLATSLPTSTNYGAGTFIGNYGIIWTYSQSQDAQSYSISGKSILLRRASDSFLEVTLTAGVGSFSFQYRKGYTGTTERQLEILVNGVQVATTNPFGTTEPDPTIYTFSYNINIPGTVTIRIKNVGSTATNRHAVIDNINWTNFSE